MQLEIHFLSEVGGKLKHDVDDSLAMSKKTIEQKYQKAKAVAYISKISGNTVHVKSWLRVVTG